MSNLQEHVEPDQDTFITQLEEILESPEKKSVQGNPYELHLLLQRLKTGGINFEQFLNQAKDWAAQPEADRPLL